MNVEAAKKLADLIENLIDLKIRAQVTSAQPRHLFDGDIGLMKDSIVYLLSEVPK